MYFDSLNYSIDKEVKRVLDIFKNDSNNHIDNLIKAYQYGYLDSLTFLTSIRSYLVSEWLENINEGYHKKDKLIKQINKFNQYFVMIAFPIVKPIIINENNKHKKLIDLINYAYDIYINESNVPVGVGETIYKYITERRYIYISNHHNYSEDKYPNIKYIKFLLTYIRHVDQFMELNEEDRIVCRNLIEEVFGKDSKIYINDGREVFILYFVLRFINVDITNQDFLEIFNAFIDDKRVVKDFIKE